MIALLFLVGSIVLGGALVRRVLGALLSHAEQALWGLVAGWTLTTLAAYLLARLLGDLSLRSIVLLTALIWTAALSLWFATLNRLWHRRASIRSLWRSEYVGLLLVLLLFAPLYLELFWTRMLRRGEGGIYSGGSTWFDIGLHMAISNSFLYGRNYPPIYTPFPAGPLLYPFLPDFQTALLVRSGLDMHAALVVTGVALALAITGLFYSLSLRLQSAFARARVPDNSGAGTDQTVDAPAADTGARAQTSAALATLLFLLNGGLGFLYFYRDWRASGKTLTAFWSHLETNYANMGEEHIQWTNLISDAFLPQRPSLFGFALALMCFTLFAVVWQRWTRGKAPGGWDGWRLLLGAGALTGAMPFFHAHSYASVGLVSGFLFLLKPRRVWLAFWTPAILLALPHLINLTAQVGPGFMRFQPGWRGHHETNWMLYWFRNIGIPLLLIIPAYVALPGQWRTFYLAFVGLLSLSLLVVISPNDYDNIKLMYYWYALTCIVIASWLVKLAGGRCWRAPVAVLVIASITSGALALQYERSNHKLLFSAEELAAAAYVREHTREHALFLTAPTLHQPILSLAGRAVLRGDTAWLWSHGYPFQEREADVRIIYAGDEEASELLRYYRVAYVYLGTKEREMLGANQSFFDQSFPLLYRSANISIYDTRKEAATARADSSGGDSRLLATLAPREFASRLGRDPYQLLVEFPSASYAVYRYYKVSFGRMPEYRELMEDMKKVGRGVFVGSPGWQQRLEDNKRALAQDLTTRDDFKALYDGLSNERYVEGLYTNAGIASDPSERDRLIAALDGGAESRDAALRWVADNSEFQRREYNTAYVLMHYFAYLRRNPNEWPDHNWDGFNFWLKDLDTTGDYRSLSRVFIESGEYKDQRGKR